MPEPIVSIRGVCKNFGAVRAVDGVSFDVNPGEIFGLLGPNGAGKTTTIRMMLDIFRSTQDGAELVALLERLVDFCTVSLEQYRALVETYPMAAAQLQPWMDRATRTVELLLQTQQEVQR